MREDVSILQLLRVLLLCRLVYSDRMLCLSRGTLPVYVLTTVPLICKMQLNIDKSHPSYTFQLHNRICAMNHQRSPKTQSLHGGIAFQAQRMFRRTASMQHWVETNASIRLIQQNFRGYPEGSITYLRRQDCNEILQNRTYINILHLYSVASPEGPPRVTPYRGWHPNKCLNIFAAEFTRRLDKQINK